MADTSLNLGTFLQLIHNAGCGLFNPGIKILDLFLGFVESFFSGCRFGLDFFSLLFFGFGIRQNGILLLIVFIYFTEKGFFSLAEMSDVVLTGLYLLFKKLNGAFQLLSVGIRSRNKFPCLFDGFFQIFHLQLYGIVIFLNLVVFTGCGIKICGSNIKS